MTRPGARILFTDPTIVTGLVTDSEIADRSAVGIYVFSAESVNETLLAEVGFEVERREDLTENMSAMAGRWHDARERFRDELLADEGVATFEGIQRFLSACHLLAQRATPVALRLPSAALSARPGSRRARDGGRPRRRRPRRRCGACPPAARGRAARRATLPTAPKTPKRSESPRSPTPRRRRTRLPTIAVGRITSSEVASAECCERPDGQSEEGHDERPASDPEKPRGDAGDHAERDERDVERGLRSSADSEQHRDARRGRPRTRP